MSSAANETKECNQETKKMLKFKLVSGDGEMFEVEQDVAYQSQLIKRMMEFVEDDVKIEPVSITPVDGKTLKKVLEFCENHRNEEYKPKGGRVQLTDFHMKFMDVDSEELLDILLAAHYLEIPGIVDTGNQKIASKAEGKTVEELREIYVLENNFYREPEDKIRKRFDWVEH